MGAGPSLERNAHLLRPVKGRVLIVAVDAALPYLWQESIYPDIAITAEEQTRSALIFRGLKDWPPGVVLVASSTVNPLVPKMAREIGCRDVFFYHNGHQALQPRFLTRTFVHDLPTLVPQAGSITFHGVELARWLGVAKIALIGVDMCVYPGKRTHAGPYGVTGIPPEVINDSFRWHMRELEHNCMRESGVVNCTSGGVLEVLPRAKFEDFVEPYRKPDAEARRQDAGIASPNP